MSNSAHAGNNSVRHEQQQAANDTSDHLVAEAASDTSVARNRETIQLAMSRELLAHAKDVLSVPRQPAHVLRYTCARLTESLDDVLSVADERGQRLSAGEPKSRGPALYWGNPAHDDCGHTGREAGPA